MTISHGWCVDLISQILRDLQFMVTHNSRATRRVAPCTSVLHWYVVCTLVIYAVLGKQKGTWSHSNGYVLTSLKYPATHKSEGVKGACKELWPNLECTTLPYSLGSWRSLLHEDSKVNRDYSLDGRVFYFFIFSQKMFPSGRVWFTTEWYRQRFNHAQVVSYLSRGSTYCACKPFGFRGIKQKY